MINKEHSKTLSLTDMLKENLNLQICQKFHYLHKDTFKAVDALIVVARMSLEQSLSTK